MQRPLCLNFAHRMIVSLALGRPVDECECETVEPSATGIKIFDGQKFTLIA